MEKLSGALIGCLVFLFLGLLLFIGGICWHISDVRFKSTAIETECFITEINTYREPDEDSDSNDVFVAFIADGVKYEGRIIEYNGDMYIGQPMTVFYNPDNPQDFRLCNPKAPAALISMGAAFLLIAASPLIMGTLRYFAMKRFSTNDPWLKDSNYNFIEKSKVLYDAAWKLNKPEQPWSVTVNGDDIVARWKWETVSGNYKPDKNIFIFRVTLNDTGKWWENLDQIVQTSGYFTSLGSFYGKTYQKSVEFKIGKNKQTGRRGLIKTMSMDTAQIKRAVRGYLMDCGYKKMRLFG